MSGVTLTTQEDTTTGLPTAQRQSDGAAHTKNQAVEEGQALGHDFDHLAAIGIPQSYVVTGTGAVVTGPCLFVCAVTVTAGTSSTLLLHDNAGAASGTIVMPVVPTATANVVGYKFDIAGAGALCQNGLYATVGGSGSPVFVVWAIPSVPA